MYVCMYVCMYMYEKSYYTYETVDLNSLVDISMHTYIHTYIPVKWSDAVYPTLVGKLSFF